MKPSSHEILSAAALEKSNGAATANLAGSQEPVVWPEELLAVAEQQQLRHCLEPMLKATREIFPNARRIKVYAKTDYQEPQEKNIVFDVQVAGLDYPQYRAGQDAWITAMYRFRPSPFIYHFVLLLDLVKE